MGDAKSDAVARMRRQVFLGQGVPPRFGVCEKCRRDVHVGDRVWLNTLDAEARVFCSEACYMNFWQPIPQARARATDPDTSHAAARSVDAFRPRWSAIIDTFRAYGPLTDEELAVRYGEAGDRLPQQSPSGLRTRRSELVSLGMVAEVGESKTASGRRCIVWGLTKED